MIPHLTVDHGPTSGAHGPTHSVIWMHGLGADGHDFEAIVPYLGIPETHSIRFIFPHADVRPVTLNGGMSMRAWYDIVTIDGPRNSDMEGVARSAVQIEELITREKTRGISADRIVIAGFSQGGALAYHVGLRHPEALAGILVLSAYLLDASDLGTEATQPNQHTPILQCHGTHDPVVTLAMGAQARDALTELGYSIDWREYPTAHNVDPREVVEVGAWLAERCA